jgi:hypothetical protein
MQMRVSQPLLHAFHPVIHALDPIEIAPKTYRVNARDAGLGNDALN